MIRQANAATMAREAIVLDLGDIMRQGEQLKARSRESADRIVEDAKRERDRLLANASEEGRLKGYEQGVSEGRIAGQKEGRAEALQEFRDRLAKLDAAWSAALVGFERDRDRMLLEASQDVLKLAVRIGELVTKRSIQVHPEAVADQLAAVLARVAKSTSLTIRIHPEDRTLVQEALVTLVRAADSATHVELVDDASLGRASVVANTAGGGEVDASIKTQLERIARDLLPGPNSGGTS